MAKVRINYLSGNIMHSAMTPIVGSFAHTLQILATWLGSSCISLGVLGNQALIIIFLECCMNFYFLDVF